MRRRMGELPVEVVAASIIVCDSRTGWTSSFNVLYTPLRAFTLGAYPVIPARRDAPVDVVPVDYVADAIGRPRGARGSTYNLTARSGPAHGRGDHRSRQRARESAGAEGAFPAPISPLHPSAPRPPRE